MVRAAAFDIPRGQFCRFLGETPRLKFVEPSRRLKRKTEKEKNKTKRECRLFFSRRGSESLNENMRRHGHRELIDIHENGAINLQSKKLSSYEEVVSCNSVLRVFSV
jgi:hypothetical protein